ncbi:hypothetical protein OH77DRAFT_1440804, partial [Trametes cingulata]
MSTRDRKCKRCTGCRKDFTTSKPACIAVREAEIGAGLLDTDSVPGLSPSGHGSRATSPATSSSAATQHDEAGLPSDVDLETLEAADEDAPPIPFEGDYFSEYAPEDFDDFDEFQEHAEDAPERTDEGNQAAGMAEAEAAEGRIYMTTPSTMLTTTSTKEVGSHLPEPYIWTRLRLPESLLKRTPLIAPLSPAPTFAVPFPGARAGAPTSQRRERSAYETFQRHIDSANSNPYAPFTSRIDWEVARWAKMRGPGSTAVSELLQIENLTSGRPRFRRREIIVAGEVFEIFYRDVIQCIRALYGDPELADLLVLTPERHYADADHNTPVYFDMHIGKWWWETQKELEKRKPGVTIIPIIISSDKTQLTVFGSKTAYPVYMTIGNLPKDDVGVHGIDLVSGDGVTRRGHPIFA